MKNIETVLQKAGLKITPARREILAYIIELHTPCGAQDIARALKKKDIDLVTIYRTLLSFEKAGIVRRVDLRTDAVVYEVATTHHHHIVCTSCGMVEDFTDCDVSIRMKKIIRASKKFTSIQDHSFELFGTCGMCTTR